MTKRSSELWVFVLVLAMVNAPLLFGRVCGPLLFVPERIASGEWWRLLTASFVHVGAYHLVLDAGAFLLLYHSLREPSRRWRLLAVAACAAGSFALAAFALAPGGSLCGLSGVGHGLLAVGALEMMGAGDRASARVGAACLVGVVAKSVFETCADRVLFASLHFGDVATPVAVCHLGGVLGGLAVSGLRLWLRDVARASCPCGSRLGVVPDLRAGRLRPVPKEMAQGFVRTGKMPVPRCPQVSVS
jgi:rhomboid family GlyGly-CTERM serine protease